MTEKVKATASLSAHSGSRVVTLAELQRMPKPVAATSFHQPIAHADLVEMLTGVVASELGGEVERVELAVGKKADSALFGVMTLTYRGQKDLTGAIGFRHANDRTMALRLVAGARVFVCDNMALHGDAVLLREKHLTGFNLRDSLKTAIKGQFRTHFDELLDGIKQLKSSKITDVEAKALILDTFTREKRVMPLAMLPVVAHEWSVPRHEEFAPRTRWSLYNAYTEAVKQLPVTTGPIAAQEVGKIFGV